MLGYRRDRLDRFRNAFPAELTSWIGRHLFARGSIMPAPSFGREYHPEHLRALEVLKTAGKSRLRLIVQAPDWRWIHRVFTLAN